MTQAETIFWTYFKGNEEAKSAWMDANRQFFCSDIQPGQGQQETDSEFRLVDPVDQRLSFIIDDMPSEVLVSSNGEAHVRWFDSGLQKHIRANPADPVSIRYNKFGKVTYKMWIGEDGNVTEKDFIM